VNTRVSNLDYAETTSTRDDWTGTKLLLQWSATDPSGICGYDLLRIYAGDNPSPVLRNSTETAYLADIADYDGDLGGGSFDTVAYTGHWTTQPCSCFSRGAQRSTTQQEASVTFEGTLRKDAYVALVMPTGPAGGAADVYVDGTRVARLNL